MKHRLSPKNKFSLPLQICLLMLFFSAFADAKAQETNPVWDFKVYGGFSIGASSPLSFPQEIRKIDRYAPAFSPRIGVESIYRLNEKWGLAGQIALEHKGFEVKNRVKSLYTEMEMKEEMYVGNFTGKNSTEVSNLYISVPVSATYFFSDNWQAQAGLYISFLASSHFSGSASDGYIRRGSPIGEKTEVDLATFDFSDKQNKTDYGLVVTGERKIFSKVALRGQLAWGLRDLFPSEFTGISFKMYNIYGTVGLCYQL